MRAARLRAFLGLVAAAIAVTAGVLLLVLGLPLVAGGRLTPAAFGALVLAACAAGFLAGTVLLLRVVARPIERLLSAATALEASGGDRLPVLGEAGGQSLPHAAIAFERVAGALADERARLAAKVDELTRANRALAEARASLVRSEKLATVGRLASGVAHEIGNPLGAITGYVELARARVPAGADPELADALGRIDAAATRIDRTVRDLLEFARPSPAALVAVDLAGAAEATLRLARVQPRFRGVEVDLRLEPGLPPVLADEHHLVQVLLNLLLNAGDATGGEGHVRIEARGEGDRVLLEVGDDGPGIAPDDLPRVFDPFFTTKAPGAGTGLGLAVSHRLMESFGGEIAAENGPHGAVFRLTFQQAPARS